MQHTDVIPDVRFAVKFMESILPDHYTVTVTEHTVSNMYHLTGIRCQSRKGLRRPNKAEDNVAWMVVFGNVRRRFKNRLHTVIHNLSYCYRDFTIIIKTHV